MKPQLSILIATLGRRNDLFVDLLQDLLTQAKGLPVEIVAYWNNGEQSIGAIRQTLLDEAKGEYVCFIDDDDKVPDYYVAEILKALGEDYVGFQVELFNDGKLMPPVYHSIRYGVWHQDDNGYYRGVTHLNPIKRSIAIQGTFSRDGGGEDAEWARTVVSEVRTEKYIDKIMYYYLHNKEQSNFTTGVTFEKKEYTRPVILDKQFRWHPKSKEVGCG